MAAVAFLILFMSIWCCFWCSKVIPERANVLYINKKYIEEGNFFVKRYGRKSDYYLNVDGTLKEAWSNNVTVHMIFYEFLHNEYKRSFVEFHFKYCDLIQKDPYVGKALAKAGMPCPLPKGKNIIHNISISMTDFPNVWPFERCRCDVRCQLTSTGELVANLEAYLHFKDRDVIIKYNKNSKSSIQK